MISAKIRITLAIAAAVVGLAAAPAAAAELGSADFSTNDNHTPAPPRPLGDNHTPVSPQGDHHTPTSPA